MSFLYLIYEREKTGFLHMRKQCGNREADRRLCFRYTDSTIPLLPIYEITSLQPSSVAVQPGLCRTWKPRRPVFSQRGSYSEWNMKAWAINFHFSGSFCCRVQNFDSFHRIFRVRGLVKKQTVLTTVCSLVFGRIGLGKQFRPRSDG